MQGTKSTNERVIVELEEGGKKGAHSRPTTWEFSSGFGYVAPCVSSP